MKKKYKVQLPAKNKLGILAHQFIEVKIADKFYSAIKNAEEKEIDDNHTYSLNDLISLRLNLNNKHSFLAKVDQYFGNDEEISKYEFYRLIAQELTYLSNRRTNNFKAILRIFCGYDYVRVEVDNFIMDIFNLVKYNKLIKKISGLDPTVHLSKENQEIIQNFKAKYDNDFKSLEKLPRSVLLIEYLLIKEGRIENYLYDKGNQDLRTSQHGDIYGNDGANIKKAKSNYSLITEKNCEFQLMKNDVIEKSILFVYSNLSEKKENIDLPLLIQLIDIWKNNRKS